MSRFTPAGITLVRLAGVVAVVTLVSCADPVSAPTPTTKAKALRDTVEGDPTTCRSGFTIIMGRIVCNE